MSTLKEKVISLWHQTRPDIRSLAELERKIGFGHGVIKAWDTVQPNIKNIQKVADFFNVPLESLITVGSANKHSILEQKLLNLYNQHTKGLPESVQELYIQALEIEMQALDLWVLGIKNTKIMDDKGNDVTDDYSK